MLSELDKVFSKFIGTNLEKHAMEKKEKKEGKWKKQCLLSAPDLALSKSGYAECQIGTLELCRVPDQGHSANPFFLFSHCACVRPVGGLPSVPDLTLGSARLGALGKPSFFIFLLFRDVFFSICSDVLWKYLVKLTQQYIFDFYRNIILLFYAVTAQI